MKDVGYLIICCFGIAFGIIQICRIIDFDKKHTNFLKQSKIMDSTIIALRQEHNNLLFTYDSIGLVRINLLKKIISERQDEK